MDPKELRVLQLGKFYPVKGGVEKVEYELMVGLSRAGVRCDMLCASSEGGDRVERVNGLAELLCCRTLAEASATMLSPSLVRTLRRVCGCYDIIHVHHPDPMACLALWLSGYGGRVVLHWHSDILKQRVLLHFYRPLQRWLVRRADLIVGTTPVYLSGSPFLRGFEWKCRCLPIGVEPMRPEARGVSEVRARYGGRKIVFSLGRLVPYKGYRYLVEAARHLGDDYVVLIGGTGPLCSSLLDQITSMGLHGKVQLLGRVSEEDLPSYYGACSVFCLSSIQKTEAFGIVQVEAMSCGKPVVATRIPGSGVSWVNADGESGVNVPPRDPAALARAIEHVCGDDVVYGRYCSGALRRYRSLFTREHMIDNCLKLYLDCYGQRKTN